MRILHVITSLQTGGAEKLMVDLLPRLSMSGHQVELVVFDGERTPFFEQLESTGVRIHSLGTGNNVYNPLNIWRLRKFFSAYDLIHTHNTACQYYVAVAKILFSRRVALVTTEHSTRNRRRSITLFRVLDKWMYRRYRRIICISRQAEETLRMYLGSDFPLCTVSNGIDTCRYASATPVDRNAVCPWASAETRILMQVAGFRPEKDQKTLIRALARLPERYHALFVGDGVCRSECEVLAAELHVAARTHFLGVRTDVPQLLKVANLVVMSSHWEGFGLAAVEGMAAGKPVIASDVPGLREVVEGAGVLFEHGNARELAEKIEELMAETCRYTAVAARCRDRAKKYDIEQMALSYESVYSACLAACERD